MDANGGLLVEDPILCFAQYHLHHNMPQSNDAKTRLAMYYNVVQKNAMPIFHAREKLKEYFSALNLTWSSHKSEAMRYVEDIWSLMELAAKESVTLPKFYACDLYRIPPGLWNENEDPRNTSDLYLLFELMSGMSAQLSAVTESTVTNELKLNSIAEKLETGGSATRVSATGQFRERLGSKRHRAELSGSDDDIAMDDAVANPADGTFMKPKSHPGRKARGKVNAAKKAAKAPTEVQQGNEPAINADAPVRKPRRTIVGTHADVDTTAPGLVGVPKVLHRDFKLCRLGSNTTVAQVRKYLGDKNMTVQLCEQLQSANSEGHTDFNNFRV
jgi:hypothetical protein